MRLGLIPRNGASSVSIAEHHISTNWMVSFSNKSTLSLTHTLASRSMKTWLGKNILAGSQKSKLQSWIDQEKPTGLPSGMQEDGLCFTGPIPDGILCHCVCVGSSPPEGLWQAWRHTAPRGMIYQEGLLFLGAGMCHNHAVWTCSATSPRMQKANSICSSCTRLSLDSSQRYQQRTTSHLSERRGLLDQGASKTTRTRTL